MGKIDITEREYKVLAFCSEEITSIIEGGAEDEYVKEAKNALKKISSIQRKYLAAVKREKRENAAIISLKE